MLPLPVMQCAIGKGGHVFDGAKVSCRSRSGKDRGNTTLIGAEMKPRHALMRLRDGFAPNRLV